MADVLAKVTVVKLTDGLLGPTPKVADVESGKWPISN